MTLAHKQAAAEAALEHVPPDCRLGVGAGSTVNCLIDQLPQIRDRIARVVAASEETAARLERVGFRCATLDSVGDLDLCIDGADEVDGNRQLLKGGGGACAREKILACAARRFVIIIDDSKQVKRLGRFPLAVEALPMARGYVARRLAAMGGTVAWREGAVTDNGNWLLDVTGLDLTDAAGMENRVNQIVGVVENGLFAIRRADIVLRAGKNGVHRRAAANDGE